MAAERDRWVWFSDEVFEEDPLRVEPRDPSTRKRAASHPSVVRGLELHARGNTDRALAELTVAASAPESRAEALLLSGQILFESGRFEEAAERFRKLAEAAPDHRAAQYNRGVALARVGRWEDAVDCFQKAALAAPERPATWFGLGVSLLHQRRGAEARAAFEQSLKLRPGHAPSLAGEAAALQMEKKYPAALTIYRRLLADKKDVPELLSNALAAAVEARERALVREWAGRLLELDPTSPAPWLAQAVAAIDAGDLREGARFADRFAREGPGSFEDWYNLGLCYQRLDRLADAFQAFERAESIRPSHEDTLKLLALLAIELKDVDAAVRYHRALGGGSWEVSFQLALLLQDERRLKESAELYREALKLKPDCVEALINLGHVLRDLGQADKARECWRKAVELRPEIASQYFDRN
jgi:tetratricopeptide (TPR) repeat protein